MSEWTTPNPIDPMQLCEELGVDCTVSDDGQMRTVTADLPLAALQAAVDAHIPAPPPPSEAALLQQQINALTDLFLFGS